MIGVLSSAQNNSSSTPAPSFTPADLFSSGENGGWYDPSDLSTLWQDSSGTTPVSSNGDPIGLIQDKSGNGNDLIQTTSSQRPTYNVADGKSYIQSDGVDDIITISYSPALTWPLTMVAAIDLSSTPAYVASLSDSSTNNNSIGIQGLGGDGLGPDLTVYDSGSFVRASINRSSGNCVAFCQWLSSEQKIYDELGNSDFINQSEPLNLEVFSIGGLNRASPLYQQSHCYGALLIDRELTAQERSDLISYFNSKL